MKPKITKPIRAAIDRADTFYWVGKAFGPYTLFAQEQEINEHGDHKTRRLYTTTNEDVAKKMDAALKEAGVDTGKSLFEAMWN